MSFFFQMSFLNTLTIRSKTKTLQMLHIFINQKKYYNTENIKYENVKIYLEHIICEAIFHSIVHSIFLIINVKLYWIS